MNLALAIALTDAMVAHFAFQPQAAALKAAPPAAPLQPGLIPAALGVNRNAVVFEPRALAHGAVPLVEPAPEPAPAPERRADRVWRGAIWYAEYVPHGPRLPRAQKLTRARLQLCTSSELASLLYLSAARLQAQRHTDWIRTLLPPRPVFQLEDSDLMKCFRFIGVQVWSHSLAIIGVLAERLVDDAGSAELLALCQWLIQLRLPEAPRRAPPALEVGAVDEEMADYTARHRREELRREEMIRLQLAEADALIAATFGPVPPMWLWLERSAAELATADDRVRC